METIKRFIECLIPITCCNLKCSYCYVIQRDNRKMKMADWKYSPEQIDLAMRKERWGGICYFSICGAGETTMQRDLEKIVFSILKNGHYVNITTNGTLKKKLMNIISFNKEYISHLHFSFSFHYLELKRLNLLNDFFENVKMVKDAGASIMVQINMCDEYMPYIEEIKNICIEKIGDLPQVAATRKEDVGLRKIELLTEKSEEEYIERAKEFNSPLFDFTMKNFNVKRKEFCYAGDWTGNLDLSTGILRRCYSSCIRQDIFKNPNEKINFLAIGNCCGSRFCMNSSHFMSLGVIPTINTPSYVELRDRENASWFNDDTKKFLSRKLIENNKEYSFIKKVYANVIGIVDNMLGFIYRSFKGIKK